MQFQQRHLFLASRVAGDVYLLNFFKWKSELRERWTCLKPEILGRGFDPCELRSFCMNMMYPNFSIDRKAYWRMTEVLGSVWGKYMQEYLILYLQTLILMCPLCLRYPPDVIQAKFDESFWAGVEGSSEKIIIGQQ